MKQNGKDLAERRHTDFLLENAGKSPLADSMSDHNESSIASRAVSMVAIDAVIDTPNERLNPKLAVRPYLRLVIDYEGLVEWGWPYGYNHTLRLMEPTEIRRSRRKDGTWDEWSVPNERQFPLGFKMFKDIPGSPYLWYVDEVLAYFLKFNLLSKRFILYFRNLGLID